MNASDKWLSRYGFVENFTAEILHFGDVLQYDVYSQVGVRNIIGIPINRDAVSKRYVSRYGLVVSVHSGILVSFRKSK